jgi:DNA-binding Xre family transcriptional regulator
MVVIKLREAMLAYKRRTGERMTYQILAARTGIAQATLEVIGSKLGYNTTVATLEKICRALGVDIGQLVQLVEEPPKLKRATVRKKGGE